MSEKQQDNISELGELLTKAREKLSLSQKDIASRLNLKEAIVMALDANDFEKLPAPTYVRGYIRSYARAVNLNADSLIKIYEGAAEAPPEILPDVIPTVQASSRDKPVKAMTYLITLTLVILIIAWWQGQHIVSSGFFSNDLKTSAGGDYPGGFTYTYEVVTHPETLEVSEIIEQENIEATELPETNDFLSIENSHNQNGQTSQDILKMELTAESWIEVYDILGQKLYMNLAKPGEKISLTGNAPLSVKLGNARVVSVNFNGKAFDTKKYTKAGVARFLLE